MVLIEPAQGVEVNSQLTSAPVVSAQPDVALGVSSQPGEPSTDTSDVCNAEAILGWNKVMSKAEEDIVGKRDMAEV